MAREGVQHIQKLLGHSSLHSTQRYTRVEISDLKKVDCPSPPEELTPDMPYMEDALEAYLEESRLHQYSDAYQQHARLALARLFRFLREWKIEDVREVSEEHLVAFAGSLKSSRTRRGALFSDSTISAYLSSLRRFFAFLERRGVILRNPSLTLKVRRAKSLPRTRLNRVQVERLLKVPSAMTTLGQRDRALVEVLYGTAIRLSECIRLDVSDVDLQNGELLVRDGKGKKDRRLPIPRQTAEAMIAYASESRPYLVHNPKEPAFFLSREGRRISRGAYSRPESTISVSRWGSPIFILTL